MSSTTTPAAIPSSATLSMQGRVRHPSRRTTVEYVTINARWKGGVMDFGRWAPSRSTNRDDGGVWDEAEIACREVLLRARLDLRTRNQTVFGSFAELLAAPYSPTLSDKRLANAYDAAQEEGGSDRRAYRR